MKCGKLFKKGISIALSMALVVSSSMWNVQILHAEGTDENTTAGEISQESNIVFDDSIDYTQYIHSGFTFIDSTDIDGKASNLVDGNSSTRWCVTNFTNYVNTDGSVYVEFSSDDAFVPMGVILTTGSDSGMYLGRNPKTWKLYGSNSYNEEQPEETEWTEIYSVTDDMTMQDEFATPYYFLFDKKCQEEYSYFRFEVTEVTDVTANWGDCLALDEIELLEYHDMVELSDCNVSGIEVSYDYTGKAICPTETITYNGQALTRGTDYTAEYSNNYSKGTATVTYTGLYGKCYGTVQKTFDIVKKNTEGATYAYTVTDENYESSDGNNRLFFLSTAQKDIEEKNGVEIVAGDTIEITLETDLDNCWITSSEDDSYLNPEQQHDESELNIVLDLNGHTVNQLDVRCYLYSVTIKDSSAEHTGMVTGPSYLYGGTGNDSDSMPVYNIEGGTYEGNVYFGAGCANIFGDYTYFKGTISSYSSSMTITGGYFASMPTCSNCTYVIPDDYACYEIEDETYHYVVKTTATKLDVSDGNIVITSTGYTVGDGDETEYTGNYIITGTSTEHNITVKSGSHNITIENLNIDFSSEGYIAHRPIDFYNASDCMLIVSGTNTLKGSGDAPGIRTLESGKLTITGTGILNAYGGQAWPGIGSTGNVNVEISNCTVNAYGGQNASAIGGSYCFDYKSITINNATVNAYAGENVSRGIGSGLGRDNSLAGTIAIKDSIVNSYDSDANLADFMSNASFTCSTVNGIPYHQYEEVKFDWDGSNCKATGTCLYNDYTETVDCTVVYYEDKGEYAAFAIFSDGTIKTTDNYQIVNLSDCEISNLNESYYYTGHDVCPLAIITYRGLTLTQGLDYTVSYNNNRSKGTATVTFTGKDILYTGSVEKTFNIVKKDVPGEYYTYRFTNEDNTDKDFYISSEEENIVNEKGKELNAGDTVKIILDGNISTLNINPDVPDLNFIIDLNGYTVQYMYFDLMHLWEQLRHDEGEDTYLGDYSLTVIDSSDTHSGKVTNHFWIDPCSNATVQVNVEGGTYTGEARLYGGNINIYGENTYFQSNMSISDEANVTITGGHFANEPSSAYIPEGYACFTTDDDTYPYLVKAAVAKLDISDGRIEITATGYSIGGGEEIAHTGKYIITGTSTENNIKVSSGSHDITIEDLNIDLTDLTKDETVADKEYTPITFDEAGDCTLTVIGTNTVKASNQFWSAGIRTQGNAKLTITGTGTLYAYGSDPLPGIGTEGSAANIEIDNCTVYAYGGGYAPGIGGGWYCSFRQIVINNATVYAYAGTNGGYVSRGIGDGYWSQAATSGTITITDSTIYSYNSNGKLADFGNATYSCSTLNDVPYHDYEEVTYAWDGDKCTATRKCAKGDYTETVDCKVIYYEDTSEPAVVARFCDGTIEKSENYRKVDLSACNISGIESSYYYTGREICPEETITYDGETLLKDTDYTVEYSNNYSKGTATVTFKGKDVLYTGTVEITFNIVQKEIAETYTYTVKNDNTDSNVKLDSVIANIENDTGKEIVAGDIVKIILEKNISSINTDSSISELNYVIDLNGCTVESMNIMETRASSITIKDSSTEHSGKVTGNLWIESKHYGSDMLLNIEGGTFEGMVHIFDGSVKISGENTHFKNDVNIYEADVEITGGYFANEPSADYIPDNYICIATTEITENADPNDETLSTTTTTVVYKVVNVKDALNILLESAKAKENYSDKSMAVLNEAIATAEQITDGSANADIVAAREKLQNAIDGLVAVQTTVATVSDPENAGILTGGGKYGIGETITLTSKAVSGYKFNGWYQGDTLVSSSTTYTVEVTEDFAETVTYIAKYESNESKKLSVNVGNGTVNYSYQGDAQTGTWITDLTDNTFAQGTYFTITAVPDEGYDFLGWVDSENRVVSTKTAYSFYLGEDVSLTALYKKAVASSHYVVFKDISGKILWSGDVDNDTDADYGTVTAPGHGTFAGRTFSAWTDETGNVLSTDEKGTIMITEDITIYASYEAISGLKVTVNGVENSETYDYNDLVTVTTDESNGSNYFTGWYVNDTLVSDKLEYSFYVKSDISLIAKYEGSEVLKEQPMATMTMSERNNLSNGKQTIQMILSWSLPEAYTLVEAGFIRTVVDAKKDNLSLDNVDGTNIGKKATSLKNAIGTCDYTLTLSTASVSKNVYAKGYVKYMDNETGEILTIYTELYSSLANN